MRIRSILAALLVVLLLAPATTYAGSNKPPVKKTPANTWRTFTSKHLGFSFRYPGQWRLARTSVQPDADQVTLSYMGHGYYSMNVFRLPFVASPGIGATLAHFVTFEQAATRSPAYKSIRWTSTQVGGAPARAGVIRPATEGGVTIATGIYVTQSRSSVFEITEMSYHKPPLRTLSQFPSVYAKILATWHFS